MDHHHHLHHGMNLALLGNFNPLDIMSVISIVSFSFFASLHCIGMCGPLVCLSMGKTNSKQFKHMGFYNLGRLISYAGSGALLGALGSKLFFENESLSRGFSIVLGVVILGIGLRAFLPKVRPVSKGTQPLRMDRLRMIPEGPRMFLLGLLTVFLPCMTLTPVLGLSVASGSAYAGALLLLAFYVGTVPAMMAAGFLPNLVIKKQWIGSGQKLSYLFFCLAGVVTILRAFH